MIRTALASLWLPLLYWAAAVMAMHGEILLRDLKSKEASNAATNG